MKHVYLFLLFSIFLFSAVQAAPGDTTMVQAHAGTQLSNYGDYDAPAIFPSSSTTYRDITMTFTLGKYQCPGNPQYCGDWDYTVSVYLYTPTDTFEIGRLITPYANVQRFPWNWQHRYNFDVTDYAQYLHGNNIIRIHYSGYSGGFTADVKFTMIEGTPPRNVVKIDRLWHGSFRYGGATSIETLVNARTLPVPAGAQSAVLKFNVTGHGSNSADNCSEFCSKYYRVNLNNTMIAQKNIWRDNCGFNNLYPQTGTWVYDRANWCPGDVVYPNYHPLSGLTAGSNFTVDVDFQPYNVATSQASYAVEGQVIYYGAYNYQTDAAMEAIISPNDYEGYFRANPSCEEARIRVKNTGSTAISGLEIVYGLNGTTMHTLPLTITILPGNSEDIILPGNSEFISMGNSPGKFTARIAKVNGSVDANTFNNEMQTEFTPMPIWSNYLVVTLATNAAGSQTKWNLYDAAGNIVKSRQNTASRTTYYDTLQLPSGCYRLEVTDTGCNGLYWWAAPSQGTGSLTVKSLVNVGNYKLKGYFNGDFGCGFTESFRIQSTLGSKDIKDDAFPVTVFPNPAQNLLQINIAPELKIKNGTLELYNMLGQKVYSQAISKHEVRVPVQALSNGVYLLKCRMEDKTVQKQIVINH